MGRNFVIRYLSIFLLVGLEALSAMEAQMMSFQWESVYQEGRVLQGTHARPPLISPAPPKHSRTNVTLVTGIVVLMVMAVCAILCCCYQWEGQMRLQSQAHSTGHSELLDDTRSSSPPISFHHSVDAINTRDPPRAASISVIMPGDDIPRFVAWVVPRGSPIASTMPESRNQQQAPDPYSGKLAHTSVVPVHASVGVDRV